MEAITEHVKITNSLGLHARPAAKLVQEVLKFESQVHISLNGHKVNAKSIMGLLTLAAACGSDLAVTCEGPDAREAMDAVRAIVEAGFGEA